MGKNMKIDFAKMGGPVFTGRDRGEDTRKRLNLDDVKPGDEVDVVIPEDVYTVTSSYFLGLFGKSIRDLGLEAFHQVFHFDVPVFLKDRVEEWSLRAVRERRDLFRGA
jgi:hypothetical protein